jgi:hypothetical protein
MYGSIEPGSVGRLFHTWGEQEVTLTGQTCGKYLVAFRVKGGRRPTGPWRDAVVI